MTILFENLLQISVGAGILGLLVLGARFFIKSRHTLLMTVLYTMFIVKLIVPFSIESPFSVQNLIGIQQSTIVAQQGEYYTESGVSPITDGVVNQESLEVASPDMQSAESAGAASVPTLFDIAAIVWIAGVAILTLAIMVFNVCFMRKLRKNRPYNDPDFDALLSECKNAYNIRQKISVIQASDINAAAVYGMFRPKLLISPSAMTCLTSQGKRNVLMHELSHIKRRDMLTCFISVALCIVHWFNPIVWIVFCLMRKDIEVMCDYDVIHRIGQTQRRGYAETLLSLAESNNNIHRSQLSAMLFISKTDKDKKLLKRRLKMISRTKKNSAIFIMLSLLLTVVIAVAGCTSSTQQDNAATNGQDNATTNEVETTSPQTTLGETASPSAQSQSSSDDPSHTPSASDSKTQHKTGEYVGQIDSNSIEIVVDDEPAAYRLTEITKMQVSVLTEGQTIGFTYEVSDVGQDVIISFDDIEQTMNATYVGLADAHTMEVMRDGTPISFQLKGDALTQVNSIKEGDLVVIVYSMNKYGQNVATSVTKK